MRTPPRLTLLCVLAAIPASVTAQQPSHLRDRGPGVPTSMFGTYVQGGELLVYPFAEWYRDANYEYKPSELGYGREVDHRGRYRATEGLIFLAYGVTRNLAIELEGAVITAELEKAPDDPSAMPSTVRESGLGDVEGQLRWRWRDESARRPELFSYFETVFPLQRAGRLIGTSAWEFKFGTGMVRGFDWGTMTVRAAAEWSGEEGKLEAGEYAIEYLRRLSPSWRVFGAIEGNQIDEVELITEAQWHFRPRAFLKANVGWGLTPNATDLAPELGVMFSF